MQCGSSNKLQYKPAPCAGVDRAFLHCVLSLLLAYRLLLYLFYTTINIGEKKIIYHYSLIRQEAAQYK